MKIFTWYFFCCFVDGCFDRK